MELTYVGTASIERLIKFRRVSDSVDEVRICKKRPSKGGALRILSGAKAPPFDGFASGVRRCVAGGGRHGAPRAACSTPFGSKAGEALSRQGRRPVALGKDAPARSPARTGSNRCGVACLDDGDSHKRLGSAAQVLRTFPITAARYRITAHSLSTSIHRLGTALKNFLHRSQAREGRRCVIAVPRPWPPSTCESHRRLQRRRDRPRHWGPGR